MKKIYLIVFTLTYFINVSQIASYKFTNALGIDDTGNGNTGTFYDTSAYVDTLLIGANTNDYFKIPSTVLNNKVEFSLVFKIKFNGLNTAGGSPTNHLFSGDLSSTFGSFALSYQKDVNKWYFVTNGYVCNFSDASIITGKWYCVCLTRSASGIIKFYIDGVQYPGTYTNSTPLSMTNLLVGQETDCYGSCFAANQAAYAKFDFIKIYSNEILSQDINTKCVETLSGIDELNNNNFTFFSNPVISTLSISNATEITHLEILSIEGKNLFSQNAHNQSTIAISMDDFASGIYLLKVVSGNKENTYKILKN